MVKSMTRTKALLLVAGWAIMLLAACGEPQPAPTPAPEATTTPPDASLSAQALEELAEYCAALINSTNPFFGTHQRASLAKAMSNPNSDSPRALSLALLDLAQDHLRFGEVGEAIRLLKDALDQQNPDDPYDSPELLSSKVRSQVLEALAVAYLKMGELNNCLSPTGGLICTLPLDRTVIQTDTLGSSSAIEYLIQLLRLDPDNLKARWLLNVAHMTLGTYPEQVPDIHLIPPEALGSDYDIGRFQNLASSVGLYTLDLAGGSIIEDFDGDGLLDIITSTWDPCRSLNYFHNDGNGLFSDYTSRAGLDGQLGGLNIMQTDYNNDGRMDVMVMRGAWMLHGGQMRNSLLRNNEDGTFTDVTHQAGLAIPAYPSHSAAWADYDNDGDLDLYSCNESIPVPDEADGGLFPSQLFRNDGDGTFTDVATQSGVTNLRYCKGSVWGDYDNDGDPDLYVSNYIGDNRLYRNNADGSFTDVAPLLGVEIPHISFATWFWDYDNDGWLDLFVADYGGDIGDVAAGYLGLPNRGTLPKLYRNDRSGGFVDVTQEAGLARVHLAMGANFGDLDNDGYPDFFLGTGDPSFEAVGPNVMYRNNGGESFVDVTFSGGFGHLQKGHGIAFGDLDRDGDQDIFAQIGGAYPGDAASNALYENPGHGNRWVSVRLVGVESNRAAIGARIRVELATEEGVRNVYARVGSGGSFGASSLEQEIGLGQAQRIITLEVYWPTSHTVQEFRDVPIDAQIEIHEGWDEYKTLDLPEIRFRR